jgi:hypothetical protein
LAAAKAAALAAEIIPLSEMERLVWVVRWPRSSSAVVNRFPQYSRPFIQLQICGPTPLPEAAAVLLLTLLLLIVLLAVTVELAAAKAAAAEKLLVGKLPATPWGERLL